MSEEAIVICMLVRDLPVPSVMSKQMLCTECRELVWVSQSSPLWASPVCTGCAPATVNEDSYSIVTAAQRQVMYGRGMDDAEIEELRQFADRWLGLR